jgi:hypothetical protein
LPIIRRARGDPAPEDEPWRVANEADVLVIRPSPVWPRRAGAGAADLAGAPALGVQRFGGDRFLPCVAAGWPAGQLRARHRLEEIADYVIAAIYRQAKDLDGVAARGRRNGAIPSLARCWAARSA